MTTTPDARRIAELQAEVERLRAALTSPTKAMLDAGMVAAEDCLDHDWDSGPDGEGYNSYTTLRSDAPAAIWKAMAAAILQEQHNG